MKKILLLLILIIVSSCSSNDDNTTKKVDALAAKTLQGKWTLISTTNGVDNTISTPASTKTTVLLEFSGSNFKKYTNGVLTINTTFKVLTQSYAGESKQTIVIGGPNTITNYSIVSDVSFEAFKIKDNVLTLNMLCNKCNSSSYTRIDQSFY
ncbi:hypothetical protein [Flavobacterium sp. FlaQc-48]|uniref:hypothetical protein n=1 Tax=Flavobacterium sp. FlaQc-48 TaxID=3374181 RepID=UPI0037572664